MIRPSAWIAAWVLAAGVLLPLASGIQAAASNTRTAAELKAVKAQIEQLSRDLAAKARQQDQLGDELRLAETASAAARSELGVLSSEQSELSAKRDTLARERARVETRLLAERATLASQLRVAYMVGSTEPLQLVLGQRDPLQAERLLTYYGYFGRARAGQIAAVAERIARIDVIDNELQTAETRLATIKREQQQRVSKLESQRAARRVVLDKLKRETQTRTQKLARLKTQQSELETLLRELSRVVRSAPAPEINTAFGRLQGKLSWPVNGRLIAGFGSQRAAGVHWDGVIVATERGAPVRAVAAGSVVYADWLSGWGLVVIINHGDGYWSVYGFNDELRAALGDSVVAGDVVAAAGDSGGRSQPELYFEIRRNAKPINPQPFFSSRSP